MEKTIQVGDKELKLSNNIGWALAYRDQFGTDIIMTLTPVLAAGLDVIAGVLNEAGQGKKNIDWADVLRIMDGDALINAIAHISALEFTDMIHIVWAMAKAADDDIPDPNAWVKEFEVFPVDEILPEAIKLAVKGMVSTKNVLRLKNLLDQAKGIQPLTSTPSS